MPNILLTGSSRGIGAAIAATLAARDDVRLIGHGTTSGIAADFADPAAPQTLWNAALDALGGRIDVLINNAGVFEDAPLDQPHARPEERRVGKEGVSPRRSRWSPQ